MRNTSLLNLNGDRQRDCKQHETGRQRPRSQTECLLANRADSAASGKTNDRRPGMYCPTELKYPVVAVASKQHCTHIPRETCDVACHYHRGWCPLQRYLHECVLHSHRGNTEHAGGHRVWCNSRNGRDAAISPASRMLVSSLTNISTSMNTEADSIGANRAASPLARCAARTTKLPVIWDVKRPPSPRKPITSTLSAVALSTPGNSFMPSELTDGGDTRANSGSVLRPQPRCRDRRRSASAVSDQLYSLEGVAQAQLCECVRA